MGQATTVRPTATGHNRLQELWAEAMAEDPERCSYYARLPLCREYAWAIPDEAAIQTIVDLGPVVEIGAGLGYWASLVSEAGGRIVAFDHTPAGHLRDGQPNPFLDAYSEPHFDVQLGGTEVLANVRGRALLLVWPPWDSTMASDALESFVGDTLIYVGEGRGGCTGDRRFFEILEADWTLLHRQDIPTWPGLGDELFVFCR